MAILDSTGAISLRDESVQAEHESRSEESDRGEERAADADRADGTGLTRPTITVSTRPMATQPSSAATTGSAKRSMGGSSRRSWESMG